MEHDVIPPLLEPLLHELKEEELLFEEFISSKCRFLLYEAEDGEPKLRFDKLDASTYANYVALLSAPQNKKAYEFLKLVMEGVRLIKLENSKAIKTAIRIEQYLK